MLANRRRKKLLQRLQSGAWLLSQSKVIGWTASRDNREFVLKNSMWADFYWVDVYTDSFRALLGGVSPSGFVDFDPTRKQLVHDPSNRDSVRVLRILHDMASRVRESAECGHLSETLD